VQQAYVSVTWQTRLAHHHLGLVAGRGNAEMEQGRETVTVTDVVSILA
jgi:hypothetical protein